MGRPCPLAIDEELDEMKRPSFSRVILPALAVLGIIGAIVMIASGQPNRTAETPVVAAPATPDAQRNGGTVAGAGLVEPASEIIDIGTPIGGIVEALYVTAGERVGTGQPLFRIDTRDARAAVAEAAAQLDSARKGVAAAQSALDVANNQLALYRNVSDPRAVSKLELVDRQGASRNARAQVSLAQAQAQAAGAQLQRARVDLERRVIRAPIAGQVLQVRVRQGEFAPAGNGGGGASDPLMTMGQTDPLHVRIDIDEDQAARANLGANAIVSARGDAAKRVSAVFVRAEPQVIPKRSLTNNATERVDVRVLQLIYALPREGHAMFVGQQVDAFIPAKQASAK
jgi:HlyD family secretion protein